MIVVVGLLVLLVAKMVANQRKRAPVMRRWFRAKQLTLASTDNRRQTPISMYRR